MSGLKQRVQEIFDAAAPPVGTWVVPVESPRAVGRVTKVEVASHVMETAFIITVDFGSSIGVFTIDLFEPKLRPADAVEILSRATDERA